MTHPPASRNYSEQQAGSLRAGDHLILPDGNRSAEVHRVDVETDDFGTPAMVLATLSGGGVLRIAAGSAVRIAEDGDPRTDAPSTNTESAESAAAASGDLTSDAAAPDTPSDGAASDAPATDGAASDAPATDGAASDRGAVLPSGTFSVPDGDAAGHAVVVPPLP